MKRKEAYEWITKLTNEAANVSGTVELKNAVTGESHEIDLLALTSGIIAGMNVAVVILEMSKAPKHDTVAQETLNQVICEASQIYAGAFLNDRYSHGNE